MLVVGPTQAQLADSALPTVPIQPASSALPNLLGNLLNKPFLHKRLELGLFGHGRPLPPHGPSRSAAQTAWLGGLLLL
jgi:hypothetical protein